MGCINDTRTKEMVYESKVPATTQIIDKIIEIPEFPLTDLVQSLTESEYNRKFIKGSLPSIEEEKKTEDNNNESP